MSLSEFLSKETGIGPVLSKRLNLLEKDPDAKVLMAGYVVPDSEGFEYHCLEGQGLKAMTNMPEEVRKEFEGYVTDGYVLLGRKVAMYFVVSTCHGDGVLVSMALPDDPDWTVIFSETC